jgi:putative membrane protein
MPHEYFWWGPMWFFPMAMPIVMVLVLVLCLYFMFGRSGARPPGEAQPGKDGDSALDILKKRYARGEITREEYEQIKKDILS